MLFNKIRTNLKLIIIILIIVSIFWFLLLINKYIDYTMDDAFIIMRYAENFAEHGKLVFNLDEKPPSEVITSPFWAIILSFFIKLKTDPLIVSKILGLTFILLSSLLMFFITFKIINNQTRSPNSLLNEGFISLIAACLFLMILSRLQTLFQLWKHRLGLFYFLHSFILF